MKKKPKKMPPELLAKFKKKATKKVAPKKKGPKMSRSQALAKARKTQKK